MKNPLDPPLPRGVFCNARPAKAIFILSIAPAKRVGGYFSLRIPGGTSTSSVSGCLCRIIEPVGTTLRLSIYPYII